MNPAEDLGEREIDAEEESEEKEKTICARLVLTLEQVGIPRHVILNESSKLC